MIKHIAVSTVLAIVLPLVLCDDSTTPLAQGGFSAGNTAGWSTAQLNGLPTPFQPSADVTGLLATDTGHMPWYFIAPDTFSGNFVAAYNGKLMFKIVHAEVADANANMIAGPIIALEASCGHSLLWSGRVENGVMASIMLNEDAGWKDSRTGKTPSLLDFFGVLNHLQTIKIRGGFYSSAETTRLEAVSVSRGKAWYPCCNVNNDIDVCVEAPSEAFTPPNAAFYCPGSQRQTIRVSKVSPRFSRRTGGAVITVTGENFGLAGTEPIVRVDGQVCQKTWFPPSKKITPLFGDVELNNKERNALLNAYEAATDSMRAIYPEHCWNGMLDDGSDTGYNYGTAAIPKYLNQGETGIDTGGPCFPTHCSSCPDNSKAWCSGNQIVAVSSGVCKGRGNQDLACAATFPYQNFPNMCPDDAERTLTSNIISQAPTSGLSDNQRHSNMPSLAQTTTVFDLLDFLATELSAAVTMSATSITVTDATALVCENMNDAATRNCTVGSVRSSNDLIENYVKIYDKMSGTSEVVKVRRVTGNTLTVTRGQGESRAAAFELGAEVRMCGRLADCIIAADVEGGRFIKINNEIMEVTNAGGITFVSLSADVCGSGYNASAALVVNCTAPCNSSTPLTGTATIDPSGQITGVTITDSGSGYSPLHLPTISVANGTGCTLTPWWSSMKVARGQAGTTAAAHGMAPLTAVRLNCLDSVETGENCGGTCKPCHDGVLAPPEQDTLLCVTPESGTNDDTLSLSITVEASPGPKFSPYAVRMNHQKTAWEDKSTSAVSCISEYSRGFLYGAHDAVWGVHAGSSAATGSVQVTAMAVDENQGEVYLVGTMQSEVSVEGKHLLSSLMGGSLSVSPATTPTATCTGAAEARHDIAGVGNADCGRASFIAKMDLDGKAVWLNKIESRGTASATHQAVITDASFDQTNSELYIVGYFGDGDHTVRDTPTLHLFDIASATRTAAASSSTTLVAADNDVTNHVYQEGFVAKYSRLGAVQWVKSIGASRIPNLSGMTVSSLKVFCYKASTSHIINTHLQGDSAPPNRPTHGRRQDIEYDKGQVVASVQGSTAGGTSSATLKAASSSTNGWYNGLTIEITNGPGYGQTRTIFEYDGSTKTARVQPHWDPAQLPTSFSTYRIVGGRPTSWIQGTHWSNGGVYVTGQVQTVCGTDCMASNNKTASSVRIGTMPSAYQNSNAAGTAKTMQLALAQDDHLNFLSQFDNTGSVFWTRAIGVNGHSGYVQEPLSNTQFNISADASEEDAYYVGATMTITDGTGVGESRVIVNYTGSTRFVSVNYNFSAALDTSTRYIISSRGTAGRVLAGSTTTVQLQAGPARSGLTGAYVGLTLLITAGAGVGQLATVQAYDGSTRTATVSTLATAPDDTSYFQILDASGIKGVAAMEDQVYVTGFYTSSVRMQNCSFDSATVSQGPPANTHPVTVFECGVVGAAPPGTSPNSASKTEAIPHGSMSTDVASISFDAPATSWGIFTVAFNGSGAVFWAQNASGGAVMPKAIAVLDPLIAGRPLRGQPRDATHAKDIGSEKWQTAVARGRFVYVVGEVYDWSNPTDFGRTLEPRECSAGFTLGEKGLSTLRLRKAACAGQVVATGSALSWPASGVSAGNPDLVVVSYAAETGVVQQVRRLGQRDRAEKATSVAVHPLTGAVFVGGEYFTAGTAQGSETAGGGEDVFGLASAKRREAVGCPRQRWEGSLELGESGKPDCRLYSHSASSETGTGFLLKLSYNGDETNRGNLNRRELPSVTGHAKASSSAAPCSGGTADADGTTHVLTGASACATHVSGCSCLHLAFESRTFAASAVDSDATAAPYGPGPDSKLSGYKIRITAGKSMGYEGVVSAYTAASGIYNVVPALHAELVDETSQVQLVPLMQFLPRNHLAACDKAADLGCNAYGVEWIKSVGNTISTYAATSITGAASRVEAIAQMDSDVYVAGGFRGFEGQNNDGAAFAIEGVDELVGYQNPSATSENSYLVRFKD